MNTEQDALVNVPWLKKKSLKIASPIFRMSQEIMDFHDYLAPNAKTIADREMIIRDLSATIKELWPTSEVGVFGSTATKLFLPDSDIDLVVLAEISDKRFNTVLHKLGNHLLSKGIVDYIEVITTARVPIIKLREKTTQIKADICFNRINGLKAAEMINSFQTIFPEFRYLVYIIKAFLRARNLHESFKGGLSSFLLQLMIVHFLQDVYKEKESLPLAELLIKFFDTYGNQMNYDDLGISIRNGGHLIYKKHAKWMEKNRRMGLLTIESPYEKYVDIGGSCYNFKMVQRSFKHAVDMLKYHTSNSASFLYELVKMI